MPEIGGAAAGAAAAAAVAAAILLAVIVVLIIATAVIQYVDERYPRINLKLRHYTNSDGVIGIVTSKLILETVGGTFGNGVYFADALDEAHLGVGCPPNALDVATRFEIPKPGSPDPSRATNYVEVLVTRANYYIFGGGTNGSGGNEITIAGPLVPTPIRDGEGNPRHGLYIGPWAFGIQQDDVCF